MPTVICFRWKKPSSASAGHNEGSRSRKALETYLLAVGVTRTPAEYQSVVRRLGVEKEVLQDIKEKLAKFGKKPEVSADLDNPDEILQKLTREYHRSTGS